MTKQQLKQLVQSGRFEEARALGEKLCKDMPGDAEAWFLLGAVHGQLGEFSQAEFCCRQALSLQPAHAGLYYNLAVALLNQGKPDNASDAYLKVIELDPGFVAAYSDLSALYIHRCFYDKAINLLGPAVQHMPDVVDFLLKLGVAYHESDDLERAMHAYQRVLALQPGNVDATYAMGRLLRLQGRLGEAASNIESVLRIRPDHAEAMAVLGGIRKDQCRIAECLAAFRGAMKLQPERTDIHSAFLLNLNYSSEISPEACFDAHRRWGEMHAQTSGVLKDNDSHYTSGGRLRVGYVSPDFRTHSVAYFFEPLLRSHDRNRVECFCYADFRLHAADETSKRLESQADHWRDITHLNDSQAANLVREDEIDILVDLAGHTAGSRLGIFAFKPAAVQITYLGYPNTTGISAMDYRIADSRTDPEGLTERYNTEKLIRLPSCFLCYQPLDRAPEPGPVPSLSSDHVTFGSFNTLAKLTPGMINAWTLLLRAVRNSCLFLKNSSFRDASTRNYYYELFEHAGIEKSRLDFSPGMASLEEHLAAYNKVDIALDTFPYNGTTTSFEALWMGVPVVTLSGSVHASRVGLSILSCIGLDKLVTESVDDYISSARALAADLELREEYRHTLRDRMRASVLCDTEQFTRAIEAAYIQTMGGHT